MIKNKERLQGLDQRIIDCAEVKTYRIYGLYSSKDPLHIRYIGFTNKRLQTRLTEHKSESRYLLYHRHKWIQSHLKNGYEIKIVCLLDNLDDMEVAKEREKTFIKKYKQNGYRLTNGTNGGDGFTLTAKAKIKMKKTCLKKYGVEYYTQSQEHKDKMKKTRGRTMEQRIGVEEAKRVKDILRKKNLGRIPSNKGKTLVETVGIVRAIEIKDAIKKAHTGRVAYNKGLSMSQEQKDKLTKYYIGQYKDDILIKVWYGMNEIKNTSEYWRRMIYAIWRKGENHFNGFAWLKICK